MKTEPEKTAKIVFNISGKKLMWWYFVKLKETNEVVTYKYGFETKEVSGIFEYEKTTCITKIIKYAENHTEAMQKIDPLPASILVKEHGSPDERMIAFG